MTHSRMGPKDPPRPPKRRPDADDWIAVVCLSPIWVPLLITVAAVVCIVLGIGDR